MFTINFERISFNNELAANNCVVGFVCATAEYNNTTEVSSKNPAWVYGRHGVFYNDRNISRFLVHFIFLILCCWYVAMFVWLLTMLLLLLLVFYYIYCTQSSIRSIERYFIVFDSLNTIHACMYSGMRIYVYIADDVL